eukprot:506946_1
MSTHSHQNSIHAIFQSYQSLSNVTELKLQTIEDEVLEQKSYVDNDEPLMTEMATAISLSPVPDNEEIKKSTDAILDMDIFPIDEQKQIKQSNTNNDNNAKESNTKTLNDSNISEEQQTEQTTINIDNNKHNDEESKNDIPIINDIHMLVETGTVRIHSTNDEEAKQSKQSKQLRNDEKRTSLDDIAKQYENDKKKKPKNVIEMFKYSQEINSGWNLFEIRAWWKQKRAQRKSAKNNQSEKANNQKAVKSTDITTKAETGEADKAQIVNDEKKNETENDESEPEPEEEENKYELPLNNTGIDIKIGIAELAKQKSDLFTPSTNPAWNYRESEYDVKYNIQDIGECLRQNGLVIQDEQLQKIDKAYQDKWKLIDNLCEGYTAETDAKISFLSNILLTEMEFELQDRQRFYEIVLKQMINKTELSGYNFMKIILKTANDLKLDIDVKECKTMVRDAELSGKIFNINPKESRKQFIETFKLMVGVKSSVWGKIYKAIDKWTWQHVDQNQLDYDRIRDILSANEFMTEDEIRILQDSLKKTEFKYDKKILLTELWNVYENKEDHETEAILTHILMNNLNFTEMENRQPLYGLLLHGYFPLKELDNKTLITILIHIMKTATTDDFKPINLDKVAEIVREKRLNGKIFIKGQPEFLNSIKFAKLFESIENYIKKKFVHLYLMFKKLKPKDNSFYKRKSVKLERKIDEYAIKCVRFEEKDNTNNPLPKYIHKCIWFQSWDEKIEALIDYAVLKLLDVPLWTQTSFIDNVYGKSNGYYEAVKSVYAETGKETFFDTFVRDHYQREIDIWKIKLEQPRTIKDKRKILDTLKNINFKEFDFDSNDRLDKKEFKDCLSANSIHIPQALLNQIFEEMDQDDDGAIQINEFETFKEKNDKDIENSHSCYFKWHKEDNLYGIYPEVLPSANKIPVPVDDRYQWMVYVPNISKKKQKLFTQNHPCSIVNGYWKNIKHKKLKRIENEQLSEEHLNQIFAVLNYYYKSSSEGPLAERVKGDNKISVTFVIREQGTDDYMEYEYELKWWNQKGRYETNAIAIKNQSQTLCYIRFSKNSKLEWKWYDNDTSDYKLFGLYKDGDGNDII